MATTPIPVLTSLDFADIKSALQTYLQSNPVFTDYNFAGSGLSILLDVLAWNTLAQSFYLNQTASEYFIDSAQQRASVVSLAQQIGYEPRSARAAVANATFIFSIPDQSQDFSILSPITIPQYTTLTTSVDSNTYIVVTPVTETATVQINANGIYQFVANDVTLVQGVHVAQQFSVQSSNTTQRFVLPNPNIDTTLIQLQVLPAAGSNVATTFVRSVGITAVGADDAVFWTQETTAGQIELIFGNNIIGKALEDGNVILVDYIVTDGDVVNDASVLTFSGTIDGYTLAQLLINTPLTGGAQPETIDSIRFLAPRAYTTQQRCVTADDFATTLLANIGGIAAVNVWGGEDGDPRDPQNRPAYGKVFIAIKPTSGSYISTAFKNQIITNILRPRSVVTIDPIIIDVDDVFLRISSVVKYDSTLTIQNANQIRTEVLTAIETYSNEQLSQFGEQFRYSQFMRAIDDADPSILNNLTAITMKKIWTPVVGVQSNYVLRFGNPIYQPTDFTNTITVWSPVNFSFSHADTQGVIQTNCYLESAIYNDAPILRIVKILNNATKIIVQPSIGTIDFSNGIVSLMQFAPTALSVGTSIPLYALPQTSDLVPSQNQLLSIDLTDSYIVVIDDRASGTGQFGFGGSTNAGGTFNLPGTA